LLNVTYIEGLETNEFFWLKWLLQSTVSKFLHIFVWNLIEFFLYNLKSLLGLLIHCSHLCYQIVAVAPFSYLYSCFWFTTVTYCNKWFWFTTDKDCNKVKSTLHGQYNNCLRLYTTSTRVNLTDRSEINSEIVSSVQYSGQTMRK